jgi:hypothetical protein
MNARREPLLGAYRRRLGEEPNGAKQTPASTQSPPDAGTGEPARVLPPGQTMLDFRFANGDRMALAYIDLRAMRFNPSEGIVLEFATRTVTIKGRRLKSIYEYLGRHQISYLSEQSDGFDDPADGKPIIERIIVADRDENEGVSMP